VTAELRDGRSIVAGHNAVEAIMREIGIKGLPTRRLPKGARVAKVTSLDLVGRVFARDRPNELWMTDITESDAEGRMVSAELLVLGESSRKNRSDRAERIVTALKDAGEPLRRKDLAAASGGEGGSFDRALRDMENRDVIVKDGDLWALA
jgi:hypothetical protein